MAAKRPSLAPQHQPAPFKLFLRGPFVLEKPNGEELVIGRKKSKALLALLALSENGARSRRWLQDKLWSEKEHNLGAASLRQELQYLRKLQEKTEDVFVEIRPDAVRIDFEKVAVDVRVNFPIPDGQEILEGMDLGDPEFEDWLRDERIHQNGRFKQESGTQKKQPIPARSVKARPTLYVADFEPLGGGEALYRFTRGLKSEILVSLSSLNDIFEVTDSRPDQFEMQAYELTGSVRRANGVRITTHLLQLPKRRSLWSARYVQNDSDETKAQEELSRQIVEAIQAHLVDGEMVAIWSKYKTSLEVWELYQAGRRCEALHCRSGHLQARDFYKRALEVDPEFVPAKIVSVFINIDEIRLGWASDPDATFENVRADHLRLSKKHDDEPYVHILGAYIACLAGQHSRAKEQMNSLMRDVPDSPELKSYHALILEANDEVSAAIEMYRDALTLSQYPPNWIRTNLALAYLVAGDALAEPTLDLALASDEKSVRAHIGKVAALVRRGDLNQARTWANLLKSLQPDFVAKKWRDERFYKNPLPIQQIAIELRRAGL